ncbi:ribosome small subunit-dependent GTPase A, partial [bacterium]|nr:ribosome small subunit-dependent GTPase A [bacterium]
IGANIDVGFVVQSVDRDYNLNRLDRYLTAIINCRIIPVLILHKTDLISEEELRAKISMVKKRFAALHTIPTSRMTKQGINILMKFIRKGLTYCFIGSSGVGKSSLINSLLGKETLEIGALSDYTKKGTHTTCSRSLLVLGNGGIVIDNPGMREFGIAGDTREAAGAEGVSGRSVSSAGAESVSSAMTDAPWRAGPDGVFDKIENLALKCKYSNCSHGGEAGCAVKDALDSGELDNKKYLSYIKLKKEIQRNTMTKFEKITKDKKFGKFCKTVMARKKKAQS